MALRNMCLKLSIRDELTFPAPDGDHQAKFDKFVFMYISICVQGLNKFLKFFCSKYQPGDSYKVCSNKKKACMPNRV